MLNFFYYNVGVDVVAPAVPHYPGAAQTRLYGREEKQSDT
jgi:hypothetical protein